MNLYRYVPKDAKTRNIKTINIAIEEKPEREKYMLQSDKERLKFTLQCEKVIRSSTEYKAYISFLKSHMDMDKCTVLRNCVNGNGKHYSIEIHHTPFMLSEIVDTVVRKREALSEKIAPLNIADEVMELHYDEKIGLIPLSKTMHELVGNGKVFIPLQYVYQKYNEFYAEYEDYMDKKVKDRIELQVKLSMACSKIQSDVLTPEFVYVNIDGFDFPEVPKEWGEQFDNANIEKALGDAN
jgi:hypothetical protein